MLLYYYILLEKHSQSNFFKVFFLLYLEEALFKLRKHKHQTTALAHRRCTRYGVNRLLLKAE